MRGVFWNIDLSLLLPVLILQIISLVTLNSLDFSLFRSQVIFTIISILAFLFFSQINYKNLIFYEKPIFFVSIFLLFLVLVLGIESRGAVRWVELFGFRIQFSEILKPFLAISLASYLTGSKSNFFSLFKVTSLVTIIVLLIFLQPDLGSSIIYLLVTVFTLLFFGFPFRYFLGGLISFALFLPILFKFLKNYQRERILTFIDPTKDPLGSSYNAIQSIIAVGSGQFLGKGLGQGTQSILSFLPERHTDFIFAAITEQLGFVGGLLVIFSFGFLLFRILNIFWNSDESFSKIFSAIAFFIIVVQTFVNMGMNMGILPIVGVTLPFVSYGGSSLLASYILLGLLSSLRQRKEIKVLEIG